MEPPKITPWTAGKACGGEAHASDRTSSKACGGDAHASDMQSCPAEVLWQEARKDGQRFVAAYESHVQFICSRVQHHWHILDKNGQRVPTTYCKPKHGNKKECICKRGYPKHVVKDKTGDIVIGVISDETKLITEEMLRLGLHLDTVVGLGFDGARNMAAVNKVKI